MPSDPCGITTCGARSAGSIAAVSSSTLAQSIDPPEAKSAFASFASPQGAARPWGGPAGSLGATSAARADAASASATSALAAREQPREEAAGAGEVRGIGIPVHREEVSLLVAGLQVHQRRV